MSDRAARIRTFLAAYGDLPSFDLTRAVLARRRATAAQVVAMAEAGVEPQRTWVAEGMLEAMEHETAWVAEHRHLAGG